MGFLVAEAVDVDEEEDEVEVEHVVFSRVELESAGNVMI